MHAYTSRFVEQAEQDNVEDVLKVEDGWQIKISEGDLEADQVVVAKGPWTGELLARLGMKLPLFVKREYHMHYSAENETKLNLWVMDAEKRFLLEPMRAGICLTTGAELADLNSPHQHKQRSRRKRAPLRRPFYAGLRAD